MGGRFPSEFVLSFGSLRRVVKRFFQVLSQIPDLAFREGFAFLQAFSLDRLREVKNVLGLKLNSHYVFGISRKV